MRIWEKFALKLYGVEEREQSKRDAEREKQKMKKKEELFNLLRI